MRSNLLIIALGSVIAASAGAAANAQTITGSASGVSGAAPIGRLQPRAAPFSAGSAAERTVQEKISAFDAEQQKRDEELDKGLSICRC
jgi:hypothetical protein